MRFLPLVLLLLTGCYHPRHHLVSYDGPPCPVNSRVDYCEYGDNGMTIVYRQGTCPAGKRMGTNAVGLKECVTKLR